MSQIPPPPPQGPWPSPAPYPAHGTPPATATGKNGPALASLILGILGCIPILTGLLAIILGIVGLRKTREPNVGGKGMAVAGLVLGVISIGAWLLMGGGVIALIMGTGPIRDLGKQCIHDLADGKIDAVLAVSTPEVTRADCQTLVEMIKPLGAITDITMNSISINHNNGVGTTQLAGTVTFAKTTSPFSMNLVKVNDAWKVHGLNFENLKPSP